MRGIVLRVPILRRLAANDRAKWTRADWLALHAIVIPTTIAATIAFAQHVQTSRSNDLAGEANDIAASAMTPRPRLQVAAASAAIVNDIDGSLDENGALQPVKNLKGTRIDVTLKNAGLGPSLVTELIVTVRYVRALEACVGTGGPIRADANYDFALPSSLPQGVLTMHKNVRYEVPENSHSRFSASIGPKIIDDGQPPTVSVVDIDLVHDGDPQLRVGTFALVDHGSLSTLRPTESGDWFISAGTDGVTGEEAAFSPTEKECLRRNAAMVDRAAAMKGATFSKEFGTLLAALDRFRS